MQNYEEAILKEIHREGLLFDYAYDLLSQKNWL